MDFNLITRSLTVAAFFAAVVSGPPSSADELDEFEQLLAADSAELPELTSSGKTCLCSCGDEKQAHENQSDCSQLEGINCFNERGWVRSSCGCHEVQITPAPYPD
ncbi:MAG: hypothetical protein KDD66_03945 [Bdellovibrionales bacterium]|nr:hypothetical protein [Bdellovibrionales bacterium]